MSWINSGLCNFPKDIKDPRVQQLNMFFCSKYPKWKTINYSPYHIWICSINHEIRILTLQGINISPEKSILKMIFLFPRWDMLIPWRVFRHQPSMFIVSCHWWTWPSQGPWLCDALGDHRRTPTGRRAGRFPGAEKWCCCGGVVMFLGGMSSQKIDEQWDYLNTSI